VADDTKALLKEFAGLVAGPQLVKAATEPAKGKIPDTPYKTGHLTFLTGPAAVLGEP